MNLHDWQTLLAPYLPKIELLGEIPLERDAHAKLEQALGELVRRYGLTQATRLLQRDYPAAFVTYLAFKAAFNEERGFWDQVAVGLGLESRNSLFHPAHHWGKAFVEIIEQYPNLRRFEGVAALEYVTPIRLHGGIPAFSLPDFFQYILLPSVEKAPYDGMDDEAALSALLQHYTAQIFTDDVVRHFFHHAGRPAQSFFEKCRRMARLIKNNQPLPPPEKLGLRPYVVQAFESFLERQSAPSIRRRRPRLFFDPYTPAFRVLLPAQPLTLVQASARYHARLYDPDSGVIFAEQSRLRPRRQGQEWVIEEVEWLLEEPLETVQVALFAQGEATPLCSFSLRGLPPAGYPPLLAFRYPDGLQVRLSPSLPAGDVWLFYPADAELHFEGIARQLESLHPFAPPWQDWQAAAWDLKGVHLVRLWREGQDICVPIAVSRPLEAALSTPNLPPHLLAVDEKPLYTAAPQVCVPLLNTAAPAGELNHLRLRLESRYAASPEGNWEGAAAELPYTVENDKARVSLTPWLGESPAGTYHLSISRRGRLLSELPFRVCAGLEVDGLQPYYLPTEEGAQPVTFNLILPPNARLISEDGSEVTTRPGGFTVRAGAEAAQVDLRVELPAAPEPIRIPVRVAIPRLRWTLVLQRGSALEWSHQPISRPLAELLQTDTTAFHPRLRVELPLPGGEQPLIELHLTAPGRNEPLQTSFSRSLAAHWLEFDLADFTSTLGASTQEAIFEFQLELLDAGRNLNLSLPVLRLTREVDIRGCHLELLEGGNWRLHWCEPHPLRYRRLRLWSLWQPWSDPVEIPLPDDAPPNRMNETEGWWMWDIPPEYGLPPGEYRVQFVVVSPYEHLHLPPFPPEQAIPIQMLSPESRLQEIDNELPNAKPGRAFALHFEKMCIHQTQELEPEKQAEIQWCLKNYREASLLHLDALARWLGQYDVRENQRALLMYMFREETLQRLEKEPDPQFVQRYLSHITHVRTIRPESVRRVLTLAREPEIILRALQMLLQSDAEESRRAFWEFLERGRFSEADAAIVLKDHPDFARQLLKATPASPLRTRLLYELSRHLDLPEYLIKIGYYVLCDLGWGQLLEIRGAEREDLFFLETEQPTLVIKLLHLPGQKAEIDLAARRFSLPGMTGIYLCQCGWFTATFGHENHDLWDKHLSFCGNSRNAIIPIPQNGTLKNRPIYQPVRPNNPLHTQFGG
ncbi:hypothetical protein [Bellilinea sp.]|uniref:hypothetical protein n=1 Tax=Bellilinea sp. TaxID=2838785 RepID=UPI002ADDBE84|nr:hypothetical protein [Bellilinea sp.]